MVTGSSVSAWKLFILVLSAQQNLQEAEAVADIALYEAEKEDQMAKSTNSGLPWTEQWNLFAIIQAMKEIDPS